LAHLVADLACAWLPHYYVITAPRGSVVCRDFLIRFWKSGS
jgi:hypothetical protein